MVNVHIIGILSGHLILAVSSAQIQTSPDVVNSENGENKPQFVCNGLPKLDVLPGRGWDNLRNKDMGQVTSVTYSQCKTTQDGKYLLPDNTFVIPVKQSDVQLFSEIIDSWTSYTSITSRSFNLNVGYDTPKCSISGSFSSDYQTTKRRQVDEKSMTFRVHARYTMYIVGTMATTDLDGQFKGLLRNTIQALEANNTDKADLILELIVRDYGTHLITGIDAGAIVMQEDFISRKFATNYYGSASKLKAAASASFFKVFKFDASYTQSTNESLLEGYKKNTTSSHVSTFGGSFFKPNGTVNEWIDTIPKNLVGIDRRGDPLHFVITPYAFPDISLEMLDKLQTQLLEAILQYYAYNEHRGCMTMGSPNFDYNANIDSNLCQDPYNNYTFGGVYQTCQSSSVTAGDFCLEKNLALKNPLTRDYSCHAKYKPILLKSGKLVWNNEWPIYNQVYDTYWCAALEGDVPNNTRVMFGGVYTTKVNNPLTQSGSCPPTFIDFVILQDLHVCIGVDYELGRKYSVEFGGFFSCQFGNPLYTRLKRKVNLFQSNGNIGSSNVNDYEHACPGGYTQHPATIDQDCLVNYCVQADSFSEHGEMPVVLPPFRSFHNLFVETSPKLGPELPAGSDKMSGGAIAAVVIGSIFIVVAIIFVIWRLKVKRPRESLAEHSNPLINYETINET